METRVPMMQHRVIKFEQAPASRRRGAPEHVNDDDRPSAACLDDTLKGLHVILVLSHPFMLTHCDTVNPAQKAMVMV